MLAWEKNGCQETAWRIQGFLRVELAVLLTLLVLAKLSGEATLPRGRGLDTPPSALDCGNLPPGPPALSVLLDLYLCS